MSNKTYPILRFKAEHGWSCVYYYNGNYFYPIFLSQKLQRLVDLGIEKFRKMNWQMINADRAHPDYKNKVELSGL